MTCFVSYDSTESSFCIIIIPKQDLAIGTTWVSISKLPISKSSRSWTGVVRYKNRISPIRTILVLQPSVKNCNPGFTPGIAYPQKITDKVGTVQTTSTVD